MKAVNKLSLVVATEFTSTPGPRYKIEGDFSGEIFRQSVLEPKLKQAINENAILLINLDGTAGYGTSFLEEAFGGLIRENEYDYQTIIKHIEFKSEEEEYLIEDIHAYLKDAQNEK